MVLFDSPEDDASLDDSGAKTFSNGSSSGGAKGLTSMSFQMSLLGVQKTIVYLIHFESCYILVHPDQETWR